MKKTMKKVLIIMAVVITAMLMMTFAASAATDCGDGLHLTDARVIAPTCTEGGYTETFCTVCGKIFGTSDHKAALGHDYENANWNYVTNGDHFIYQATCARENCGTVKNDGITYYSVEFYNPWVAAAYDDEITYTKVVSEWKTQQLGLIYVAKDGFANDEDITASRKKDKAYGEYIFAGWADSAKDADELVSSDIIDLAATPVTANTELYAAFEGNPEVYYLVQYNNANGYPLTREIAVRHGQKVDDSIFLPDENGEYQNTNLLSMPETNKYYYTFSGWNIDINHLYGDTAVIANYNNNPKLYEYIYCDYEGNVLRDSEGNELKETLGYGAVSEYHDDAVFAGLMERPKDRTYIYAWVGAMTTGKGNYSTSITNMCPPAGALDMRYANEEDYAPIYIMPAHTPRLVEYVFNLTAVIPETENNQRYYLDKIIVNVLNDKGQLVGTGRTTASDDGKAVFKCTLNDSKYYTITAVTEDEKYRAEMVLERTFIYDPTYTVINTTINLELSEDYVAGTRCSCIHHMAILRQPWVTILNLLYRIFNVKYVCCDDMYATLGDVLAYTK